jgi:acid phosphatase class B
MKTIATSALLLVLAACSQPIGDPNDAEQSEGELSSNGTSYSFNCRSDSGTAKVVIAANGSSFDITASADSGVLFQATSQRPSLNVRPYDGPDMVIAEFIDFADAGVEVVPVDGPKALELDLGGKKALAYKNDAEAVSLTCRFDKAKLLRLLQIQLVSSVDMTGVKSVAFDIDDTLAFTTPTFTRAFATGGTPAPDDVVFWTQTNSCDQGCASTTLTLPDGTTKLLPENVASTAKSRALTLVAKHKTLGHRVYAVTARPDIAGDGLRDYIESELGIAREDVFFEPDIDQPGNPKGKTDRIKSLDVDIYYGDSDSDITDTRNAFLDASGAPTKKVTAVRFLRSPKSSNRKAGKLAKYHPGYFGEPIIRDSYE